MFDRVYLSSAKEVLNGWNPMLSYQNVNLQQASLLPSAETTLMCRYTWMNRQIYTDNCVKLGHNDSQKGWRAHLRDSINMSCFFIQAGCHMSYRAPSRQHCQVTQSITVWPVSPAMCCLIKWKSKKKKSILILQIVSHTAIFTHKWITISFGRHVYSTPLTYCQSSSRGSSSLNSTVTRLSHNVNFIVDTSTPRATICSR